MSSSANKKKFKVSRWIAIVIAIIVGCYLFLRFYHPEGFSHYEEAALLNIEKHKKYRADFRDGKLVGFNEPSFTMIDAHKTVDGGGLVIKYFLKDAGRSLSTVHDDHYWKMTVYIPPSLVEDISREGRKNIKLESNPEVIVFYAGNMPVYSNRACITYPEEGTLELVKLSSEKIKIDISFKIKGVNTMNKELCKNSNFEKSGYISTRKVLLVPRKDNKKD